MARSEERRVNHTFSTLRVDINITVSFALSRDLYSLRNIRKIFSKRFKKSEKRCRFMEILQKENIFVDFWDKYQFLP